MYATHLPLLFALVLWRKKGADAFTTIRTTKATSTSTRILPRLPHVRQRSVLPSALRAQEKSTLSPSVGSSTINDPSSSSKTVVANRWTVVSLAVTALLATSVAASLGWLGEGYAVTAHFSSLGLPFSASLVRDIGATILTGILGFLFVKLNTYAVDQTWLDPRDARKLIHTFSAPLFILFWPIFTSNVGARLFAALVPLTNAVRLYLAATLSDGSETSLARAVSRSGSKSEALGGPFVYVLILAAIILTFWRNSTAGIVALSTLAAGDGVADLVGRRYGRGNAWPIPGSTNPKSVAGTVGFIVASTLCSVGLLMWLQYWHCLSLSFGGWELLERVTAISVVAAIVELIPIGDDNYTVPLTAALMAMLVLQ